MTAETFRAWLDMRGLSHAEAAPQLAARRQEVWRWATGERPVPPRVEALMAALDRIEALERASG